MKKIKTVEQEYISCDFCDNKAQYRDCFVCGKNMCEEHMKEFDVIDYDLVYICPDCENKDFTKLKKLNDKYMKLCRAGEKLSAEIHNERERLCGEELEKVDPPDTDDPYFDSEEFNEEWDRVMAREEIHEKRGE